MWSADFTQMQGRSQTFENEGAGGGLTETQNGGYP